VNPILYVGAIPVLIDSDAATWNMDPELLGVALADAARHHRLPRAVIVVDLFGQCADMDPIRQVCSRYGVAILEDAAESLGALYKGEPAGTLGDVGAFSFNGNKIITTSGGGMLVTREGALAEKVRFWAGQARGPGMAYEHAELGYNYRLSNVLAGMGRGQFAVLDLRVEQRRKVARQYREGFDGVPGISPMPVASYGLPTHWLSCFLIDEERFGCSRDDLMAHLEGAGIESRPVWKPMHLQALYASAQHFGGQVAEDLFRRGICLPSSSSLTSAEQNRVLQEVRGAGASGRAAARVGGCEWAALESAAGGD
jgi:pyridoxal phosphate-dependent aminotransferase EpsN